MARKYTTDSGLEFWVGEESDDVKEVGADGNEFTVQPENAILEMRAITPNHTILHYSLNGAEYNAWHRSGVLPVDTPKDMAEAMQYDKSIRNSDRLYEIMAEADYNYGLGVQFSVSDADQ